MRYESATHDRRSVRLRGFDYAQPGAYFVTICTRGRECVFSDDRLKAVAEGVWRRVAGAAGPLDEFVVMPNHVHGIIWIEEGTTVGAQQQDRSISGSHELGTHHSRFGQRHSAVAAPLPRYAFERRPVVAGSLAALVRAFKSGAAKRINRLRGTPGAPLWQRNYYEHVIRHDRALNGIRKYIRDNPMNWRDDPENPGTVGRSKRRGRSKQRPYAVSWR